MKRIRDYGIIIGKGKTGELNKITDVPGVRVGHYTIKNGEHNTGVTAIMPNSDNIYINKVMASTHTINGFGKSIGLMMVDELGYLETPILLTNTLNTYKVADALVSYTINECKKESIEVVTVNPIVGECNDFMLNNIQDRCLGENEVMAAINDAKVNFEEGAIGAGAGTVCLGMKGGIGSSSRLTLIDGKYYTIGVLVQSNFGGIGDLIVDGTKVGNELKNKLENMEPSKGSIMIVVATDLPVTERQLKRIIKRTEVGLAKTGSYIGNMSGDVVIGFSTANPINKLEERHFRDFKVVTEDKLDYVFRQVADATEEAILNSLATATATKGYKENIRYSLTDLYLKDYIKNKNYDALINNFPVMNQYPKYPVGCESIALYTLLKYYDVPVTVEDIIERLDKGERPHIEELEMYGGDPEREFLGDPKDVYSYGVFEKPIMKVANSFKEGIKNASGSSLDEILSLVKSGYPVQVWASIDAMKPTISEKSWIDRKTGKRIYWKKLEHSLVIIGYSKNKVVVSDPDKGAIREMDRNSFEEAYNFFGKRAIYYEILK